MAKVSYTMDELETLLKRHRARLDTLTNQKKVLEQKLSTVDSEIAGLLSIGDAPRRGRPAGTKPAKKTVRRKRPKNEKSLRAHVADLLSSTKGGLALQEVHDGVLGAGYKTNSKNFKNVLYQCLYNNEEFVHDEKSGKYKVSTK